ncbi:TetR/AcrR family transcriptional regulator [Larkinella soli]|uniref:TetR/AcrR family transcriptional regulator n=1 Tax=Larkinella soli TaxID=1770527 RepID=UPI000FFB400D|nr:TetR/AcrR family transcriptional regulator [Larkinella soli]
MARPVKYDRDILLQKAMDIFWTKGYEAASVHDLLTGLDIHRGTLYDSFGDKHSLFMEVLEYYERNVGFPLLRILEQPGPKKAAIRDLFDRLVTVLSSESGRRGCLMTNAAIERALCDDTVAARTERVNAVWIGSFRKALETAQSAGEMPPRDPQATEALARYLYATVQGLRVLARTSRSSAELRPVVEIALTSLD